MMISFSLRDVPKLDTFSDSDPFIVFYALKKSGGQNSRAMKQLIGKTEVIWDQHNPDFVRQFEVDYYFEEVQNFRVEAYDIDDEDKPDDLTKHDFIGAIEFTLSQVATAKDQKCTLNLEAPPANGKPKVIIQAEEKKSGVGNTIIMQLNGQLSSSEEIFFLVWKCLKPGQFKPVFKSEIQLKNKGLQ